MASWAIVCFSIIAISTIRINKRNEGKIQVPNSAFHYSGENYEQVMNELMDIGFDNIEVFPMGDLKIGIISKENDVDKISIAGNTKFRSNEYFYPDAPIKIYYHSYPEKDNDSK